MWPATRGGKEAVTGEGRELTFSAQWMPSRKCLPAPMEAGKQEEGRGEPQFLTLSNATLLCSAGSEEQWMCFCSEICVYLHVHCILGTVFHGQS